MSRQRIIDGLREGRDHVKTHATLTFDRAELEILRTTLGFRRATPYGDLLARIDKALAELTP